MRVRQIRQRDISPLVSSGCEESFASLFRVRIAKRIVVGKYRRTAIYSLLMRSNYITKPFFAVIKNVVPGKRKSAVDRAVLQKKIRDHPRSVLKLIDVSRWVFTIRPNHVLCQKMWSGKNNTLCENTVRRLPFVIDGNDLYKRAAFGLEWSNFDGCHSEFYFFLHSIVQMRNQSSIAFRPGH